MTESSLPGESTWLLSIDRVDQEPRSWFPSFSWSRPKLLLSTGLALIVVVTWSMSRSRIYYDDSDYLEFPPNFVFGTATSAYQIEGAVDEDGRGPTIWDDFCAENGTILDDSSGAVADDHYHRYQSDIELMRDLQVQAYRFSIAWSRIVPTGKVADGINQAGIDFYNALIDDLLDKDIEPWVTMFHWDLPSAVESEYGGWLDRRTSEAFAGYARVLFAAFGDRVKRWITLNESWTVAVNGYSTGIHAPGHKDHPDTEPYVAGHSLLIAHALAVEVYRNEFSGQHGMIGMANSGDFRYPRDASSETDQAAAERAMLFQYGWFLDPIVRGDYPAVMRKQLGERLPEFSDDDRHRLIGSVDFMGLNYYSAFLASDLLEQPSWAGYWADIAVNFTDDPSWEHNDMGWNVVGDGLREMLHWVADRYPKIPIFITENGSAEPEADLATAIKDERRRDYFESHLRAAALAIEQGVDLRGYFAWSLMDNFEWQFGYQRRFGLVRVDFDTLERTFKTSAHFYADTILSQGQNIRRTPTDSWRRRLDARQLPATVLIGYGSDVSAVRRAVHSGVNVVIWAFVDIRHKSSSLDVDKRRSLATLAAIVSKLDLDAIRDLRHELKNDGYSDVVHLMSVGGWNGPHLDAEVSSVEWYTTFKEELGVFFDGIDWDLEGNDDLSSPYNEFTVQCLQKMGAISQMAKAGTCTRCADNDHVYSELTDSSSSQDGFFVTMAPPQSYLDFEGAGRFSRLVNLTDKERQWHADFQYFGSNVYAYLLAKYGDWIDLVSIQLYESYSRAALAVYGGSVAPEDYLRAFLLNNVADGALSYKVEFSDDPDIGLPQQTVRLPLDKLVIGLGNGWADNDSDKTLYISPEQMVSAWATLQAKGSAPRGLMFWTIDEEGSNGVFFANDLSRLLNTSSR